MILANHCATFSTEVEHRRQVELRRGRIPLKDP
jgi:hypothetical protein